MVESAQMDVLHVDDSLLVVNKPAGLAVLPDGWERDAPHLLELTAAQFGRTWTVHRLDKITTGVVVFARSAAAHRQLSMQFESHEVTKIYHAIANGLPDWDNRTAKHPLRPNAGHKHRTVVDRRRGKPATTMFAVLRRFSAHALLEARPITGRTHQVRAHAAALRLPLLADTMYGAPGTGLITRPALHALSLTVRHPESGLPTTFSAPYPEDFRRALDLLAAKGGTP